MIISTGMRTDIPAYFSEWFYNRIKEGYVMTRNPYYTEQVLRYRLNPDVVDCINFCTKNPEPMLERLDEIKQYRQFWFVTITPYEREIEPHVPDKEKVMESLKRLSEQVGNCSVGWRYDPVFITEKYSLDFHVKSFGEMAESLKGYVNSCVISFIDLYAKTKRNFPGVREVTEEEKAFIGKEFANIGRRYGITIRSCCEGDDLKKYGIDVSGCMTQEVIERAIGVSLDVPKKNKSPRDACNCLTGNDIGMYNTCGHGCIYCYANYDNRIVQENMRLHDPKSPFLIGGRLEGDNIKDAKQVSYADGQIRLEFL